MSERRHELSVTLPSDREILMTRAFDAPADLLFEAFTNPDHVRRWWGPDCVSLELCEIDLRVGGIWRFATRDESGMLHPFTGEYREIVPGERLVHTMVYDVEPYSSEPALVTVTFEEKDGVTVMTERVLHQRKEGRDAHLQSGMEHGASIALNQLEDLLAELQGEVA